MPTARVILYTVAQITALFKLRGRPEDELIPGTLNVGSTVPAFLGSLLFFGVVAVEPVLLASLLVCPSQIFTP